MRVYIAHHFLICCEILTLEVEIECKGTCRVLGDACVNLRAVVLVKHGRIQNRRVPTREGCKGGTGDRLSMRDRGKAPTINASAT